MSSAKEVKAALKPFVGSLIAFNNSEPLSKILQDDEKIELAGFGKGNNIIVLSDQRIIFFEGAFRIKPEPYERNKIVNFHTERTAKHDYFKFNYENSNIVYPIDRKKKVIEFAVELEKVLGDIENNDHGVKENVNLKGKVCVGLEIINGANQLGFHAQMWHTMYQEAPGEVKFAADSKFPIDGTFKLIGYDRTENFKQSISNVIGGAALGRIYGTAGAITGALAARGTGKDLSTASILLQRKNGERFILIAKCNQKTLEQLQAFIPAVTENEVKHIETASSPADEIKKYKELLDMGAITQEEFDAKKKQLLGI